MWANGHSFFLLNYVNFISCFFSTMQILKILFEPHFFPYKHMYSICWIVELILLKYGPVDVLRYYMIRSEYSETTSINIYLVCHAQCFKLMPRSSKTNLRWSHLLQMIKPDHLTSFIFACNVRIANMLTVRYIYTFVHTHEWVINVRNAKIGMGSMWH